MAYISPSLRYQVLRRDGYKCRYCGISADETKLVVDHVYPDSLGGETKAENLASACVPCNGGKAATPPDAAFVAQVEKDTEKWAAAVREVAAKAETAREGQEHHQELFQKAWATYADQRGHGYNLPAGWRNAINTYIAGGLTDFELAGLLDSVMERPGIEDRFSYFCGAARKRAKERHNEAADLIGGRPANAAAPDVEDDGDPEKGEGYDFELYNRMEALAETLDKPDVAYWLTDEMQDGWVLHKPMASGCLRAPSFLWNLLEAMVVGVGEREAIDQVDREETPARFCERCCGYEASSYNPVAEDDGPAPEPIDDFERACRELTFWQEHVPMERMRFTRSASDEEMLEYGKYMAALNWDPASFWLESSDEQQIIHRENAHATHPCLSPRLLTYEAFRMNLMPGTFDPGDPRNVSAKAEHYCALCCGPQRTRYWPESHDGELYSVSLRDLSRPTPAWTDRFELIEQAERIEKQRGWL